MSDKKIKFRPSKYGEKTVVMRIPESMLDTVKKMLKDREVLQVEWENACLSPQAHMLGDYLAGVMMAPRYGLLGAMEKFAGLDSPEVKKLKILIESEERAVKDSTLKGLIGVIREDMASVSGMYQDDD